MFRNYASIGLFDLVEIIQYVNAFVSQGLFIYYVT